MNDDMFYTFKSSDGSSVRVLRGDAAPKMTGGGGGWTVEARPRRVGLTIWNGRDPYSMDVPVLFDGWANEISQEVKISILNQMQMGHDLKPPPTVKITGAVPVKGATWIIDNIDWGDDVIYDGPTRLRQDAVVHLKQYVAETRLKVSGGGKLRARGPYIVRAGDTFKSISQKVYHTPDRWKEIMAANNIRDPKAIKKMVGKTIRIPG